MVDIRTEIIINLPKEQVAEFASDPGNAPRWCKHIKSVEWDEQHPLRAGTQIIFQERIMHRLLQHVYEVVEVIPGQKIIMRTRSNGMKLETTFGWQAVNENTTCMTLRSRGMPGAFSTTIAPLLRLAIRKASRRNLKHLKHLLEKSYLQFMVF
jgi:uncharacterized membrane protein